MDIDGHKVRAASIDAITEIEVRTTGAYEGTDKVIRGKFELWIGGQKLAITRQKRVRDEQNARDAAVKEVTAALQAIRGTLDVVA